MSSKEMEEIKADIKEAKDEKRAALEAGQLAFAMDIQKQIIVLQEDLKNERQRQENERQHQRSKEPKPPDKVIVLPPVNVPSNFGMFHRPKNECVKWSCMIRRTQQSVRHTVVSDMCRMGVTAGFVRRLGPMEVEVTLLFPVPVYMVHIYSYFLSKWGVTAEDTKEPDEHNTTEAYLLPYGVLLIKYTGNNDELSREDLDDISVNGWDVRSEGSFPSP